MKFWDRVDAALEWATDKIDPGTPVQDDTRRHRRGARLWEPRNPRRYYDELQRDAMRWEGALLRADPTDAPGLRLIGRAGLTRAQETWGVGLLGATGSGKTQIGSMLVAQAVRRGDLVLATDGKGDLTSWLLSAYPRVARLLAPWDARSMTWALHEDIRTRAAAEDLATALVPERAEGRDPYWARAARMVVEAIVLHLAATGRPWGYADIQRWLARGARWVAGQMAGTEEGQAALKMITSQSQRAASVEDVWRTILTYLSPLKSLAAAWPTTDVPAGGTWSARAWLAHAGPQIVVVPVLAAYDVVARTNARLAVEAVAAQLLTLSDSRDRRVVLFLDEFPALGEVNALVRLLVQSRSKGGVCVLGVQDVGALRATWGRDRTMSILNALATLVTFRLADPDLCEFAGRALGKHEVEEHLETRARHEGHETSTSRSEQVHVRDEYVVHPSDLQRLPAMSAYVRAPGWPQVVGVSWEVVDRTGTAPHVVEADWLTRLVTPIAGRDPGPAEAALRELFGGRRAGREDRDGEERAT